MRSVYIRQSRRILRRWLLHPGVHTAARWTLYVAAGFCLSAAGLDNRPLPLVMGPVWAMQSWHCVLTAVGGLLGYGIFWGQAGVQGAVCTAVSLLGTLLLTNRRISREQPLLIPAIGMLIVSAAGLGFQLWAADTTPVWMYLIRVALGGVTPWLFCKLRENRDPILIWFGCSLATLALAQIAPFPWLGLGFVAVGALAAGGAFPCAALAGLALDLAGITSLPMTAITVLGYCVRFLPRLPKHLRGMAPGFMGVVAMRLCGQWEWRILPGLFLGGLLGVLLAAPEKTVPHRGSTGAVQVRLEVAAGMLAQMQKLLLEVSPGPVDEDALVTRAAESACAGCSLRKNCRDGRRIAQLPGVILHKPLLTAEELPIRCRRDGRFLAQLHRAQEQMRSIHADRERQREYRTAVVQQYQFLSGYLQTLSDRLSQRESVAPVLFDPIVSTYGNRVHWANGDRCLSFAGMGEKYYVVLCDGMGTGMGAVQEGKTAGELLKKMLVCGFPAEQALASLNSLCALRERPCAVTVDLVEIALDSGKTVLYKWGAAPSYLVGKSGTEKLGGPSVPPGLTVEDCRALTCRVTLRHGQVLLLVSDGLCEETVLRQCREETNTTAHGLARAILQQCQLSGQDDATVVTVQLLPMKP